MSSAYFLMVSRKDVRERRQWQEILPDRIKEWRYFTSSLFSEVKEVARKTQNYTLHVVYQSVGSVKERGRERGQSTISCALTSLFASYPAPGRPVSQYQGPDWPAPQCLGLGLEHLPHGASPIQAWLPLVPGGHLLPRGLCKVLSPPVLPARGMEPKNRPKNLFRMRPCYERSWIKPKKESQ